MTMRVLKPAALGLILLVLLLGVAWAAEYDPFSRDPAEVMVSETVRPSLAGIYTEVMPLLGATCLVPRPPSEVAAGLTRLIAQFPSEPGLYLERGRAFYTLGRFDEAEKDFRAYADKSPDHAVAIRALADFYGDRLMVKEQRAALDRFFQTLAQEPKKDKQAITEAMDEIFSVSAAQGLTVDRTAYRRKVLDLFPDDLDTVLDFLQERADSAPAADAIRDIESYAQKFPDHPEPFLTLEARLLKRDGKDDEARQVFLKALRPDSAPAVFNAFLSLLREWGEYGDFKSELESREGKWSDQDHAVLFHLYLDAGDSTQAARVLDDWMSSTKSPAPGRVMLWAEYDMRCNRAPQAAVLLYGGMQGVKEAERGPWLAALFRALMKSGEPALPHPAGITGLYDPRAFDPDPGISGGLFSLLLNGRDIGEVLSDLATMDERHHNFALALQVRDEYRKSFLQGKDLADMDHAVVARLIELRAWNKTVEEAGAFAAAHPGDSRAPEVQLDCGRALWKLGRRDEARKQYDELLDQSEAGGKFYLSTLSEYAASLLDDGLGADMVGLYWREIGKHPELPEIYQTFLDSVSSLKLGDEELKIYKAAAQKLRGADWYSRLARFYLRRKMGDEYRQSLEDAVSQLPDKEIGPLLDQAVPEWPRNDQTIAFKASLYLMASRRWPRNPEYMRSYIRLESLITDQSGCASASCRDPLLDFAKHGLMDDHRAGKDISTALLGRLMARNLLGQAVDELTKKSGRNAAEDYFLALAQDDLGRYEQSVEYWTLAARRWPGTSYFQEQAAKRLFGLVKVRPGHFPKGFEQGLGLLTAMSALYPANSEYPVHIGEALVGEGRYADALQWWDRLISQAPGDSGRYLQAAETAWDYFQYPAAQGWILRARKRFNSPALFALELGAIMEDAGDNGAATIEYVQALSGETTDSTKVVQRLVDLAKGRALGDKIEAAFTSRLAARPDDARLVRAYADYLEATDREEEVGKIVADTAGRIKDVDFLSWARDTAHRLGPPEAEEEALTHWRDLRPNDFEAQLLLVDFYHSRIRTQDMVAAADAMEAKVLKLPRRSSRLSWLNALAAELWKDGQHDAALDLWRKALPIAQGEVARAAALTLAGRLIEIKEYAEAVSVLTNLLDSRGYDAEVFGELAWVHALRHDRNALLEADKHEKEVIEKAAPNRRERKQELSSLHYAVATALAQAGAKADALDYFIEWVNLAPDDAGRVDEAWAFAGANQSREKLVKYYRNLADKAGKDYRWPWVLARMLSWQGESKAAVEAYRAAIRDEPGKSDLHRELAALLLGMGDFKDAAETYEKLAAIDPADDEWTPLAVRMYFLAGDDAKAMQLVKEMAERGAGYHRFFAAAHALLLSGRPADALPYLQKGLKEFLARADRDVLNSDDLADLVLIRARAGKLMGGLAAFDDTAAALERMQADQANRFVRWRIGKSLDNVEAAAAGPLARAFCEYGGKGDYRALAERLKSGNSALSAVTLFQLAAGAGLADQARGLLPAAIREKDSSSSYSAVPSMDEFLRQRGMWQDLAGSASTSYEKANALLWLGKDSDAAATLAPVYHRHNTLSVADMEFLDLIIRPGNEDLMRRFLDDGKWTADEATYLIAAGRPKLAERVIKSYRRPAWVVSKQLLLNLYTKDYGARFNAGADSMFRLWDVGKRLDSPWDKDEQLSGHEQAVIMMKYAELLAKGGNVKRAADLWDAAEEDRPATNLSYRFVGQLLLELGKNDEALVRFNFARQLDPRDNASIFGAALAERMSNNSEGARALLDAMAGDTAAPGTWETDKSYQFFALLNCGMVKDAERRLATWVRNTYGRDQYTAAEGLSALARVARADQSREEIEVVTGLMQEIFSARPEDSYIASRAIEEKWLEPADLGPAYDQMVASFSGKEGNEAELKEWQDKRNDYWLTVGLGNDVIKFLNDRERGLDQDQVPAPDAARRLRALLQQGKDNEAATFLSAWLGTDLDPTPKLSAAVQAYCQENKSRDVTELQEKIGAHELNDPSSPASDYLDLADALARGGKGDKARATLERLVMMKPGNRDALVSAAQAAERLEFSDQAAHFRELASALDPLDAASRSAHAHDLYLLGLTDTALKKIEDILADPAVARSIKHGLVRSMSSWLAGDKGKAVAEKWQPVLIARAEAPGIEHEFFALAASAAAERAGDGRAAARMMDAAVALAPWFTGPAAAELYRGHKKYDTALGAALMGVKYFPSDARARLIAVQALMDDGKPDRTLALALTGSDLIAAEHMDREQPQRADELLGSDVDLTAKTALVRGLADELARKKFYGAASGLVQSLLDYLEPGSAAGDDCAECGEYCEGCEQPSAPPPCVLPEAKGPEAAVAAKLKEELDRMSKLEQREAREREQRLTIRADADNGIDWSWLMPELQSPEDYYFQGR